MGNGGTFGFKGFKDRALELPAGVTSQLSVDVSPSGRARLRYNDVLKQMEQSVDGGAYTPLGGTGAGPWDQVGTDVFPDSTGWNVTIGAAAVVGTERLRIAGTDAGLGGVRIEADPAFPSAFLEMNGADGAAVSNANEGRLRYSQSNQRWEVSENGNAYESINGPWGEASGVVSTDNTGWDVVVGAAAMSGGGEKLRVVGDVRVEGSVDVFNDNINMLGVAENWIGGGDKAADETPGKTINYLSGEGGNSAGSAPGGQGGNINVTASRGGNSDGGANSAGAGGNVTISGGAGGPDLGGGGAAGGYVSIRGGNASGASSDGAVKIGDANTLRVEIANAADNPPTGFLGTGVVSVAAGQLVVGAPGMAGAEKLRVVGAARVEGKLTVTGLIDPTGVVLDEQSTVPGGVPGAAKGTFWVKDDSPNKPYFTDDAGTDFDLLSAGAGPWDETAGVVSTDNVSWNVVVGAASMSGSGEKLRVVGDTRISSSGGSGNVYFEYTAGGPYEIEVEEATSPGGFGQFLSILAGNSADNASGSVGQAGAFRTYGGRGGDASSGSDDGGRGGRNEVFGGQGGGASGAGNQGGLAGYARIGGGKGGTATSGATAGDGGYVEIFGGQGGTGSGGDGGHAYVKGGGASPGVGTTGDGGNIYLWPGTPGQAAGTAGDSIIRGGRNDTGTEGKVILADDWTNSVEIGNVTDNPQTDFLGTGLITFNSLARIDPSDGGSVWGATSRDASAILQADSTTKGFLPPRMTRDQRNLIGSPATGLEAHNTSRSGSLDFYDGSQWREVAPYILASAVAGGGSYSASIDEFVPVNSALGSPTTITLPTAVGAAMRKITIKETAGLAGTINVNTSGGQTIDGNAGPPADTFATAWGSATYISNGSNWLKL
jgi:hypothetical protein